MQKLSRKKPFAAFIRAVLFASLSVLFVAPTARAVSPRIELRSQCLAGNELRMIVETCVTWWPMFAENSKTKDAKGYYVVVDLLSKKPLEDRARVFGPIWHVPNPRGTLSFDVAVHFTKADAAAAAATPTCVFDADGRLLRFTRDTSRPVLARDGFVASATAGSWERLGETKPVSSRLMPLSEDCVSTRTGQFTLLLQDGKVECFDRFTGTKRDDPWLTRSFAHVRSIPTLNNVRMFLTDDLNHLVVSPMSIWNNGLGKIFETFDLGGETYRRADVGFAYSRPAEGHFLFPRTLEKQASFLDQAPHAAISIDGVLYLFMNDAAMLRLYTPDGSREIVAMKTPGVRWPTYPYLKMQHAAATNEIIMFDEDLRPDRLVVSVVRWNYKTNTVTQDDVNIVDLFERRFGQLRPKTAIRVK